MRRINGLEKILFTLVFIDICTPDYIKRKYKKKGNRPDGDGAYWTCGPTFKVQVIS